MSANFEIAATRTGVMNLATWLSGVGTNTEYTETVVTQPPPEPQVGPFRMRYGLRGAPGASATRFSSG